MKIYDRKHNVLVEEKIPLSIKFLYNTMIGRFILKLISLPFISKIGAIFLKSFISRLWIKPFIKKHKVDISKYEKQHFRSFNDFFIRSYKKVKTNYNKTNHLLSICDAKLSCYSISSNLILKIKQSNYSISDLLQDQKLAQEYDNGTCLVFRLTPDDCHRYVFFDSGKLSFSKKIEGILHSVKPIVHYHFPVFIQNSREVSVLETEHFGKVVQVEIGALLIGKINNHILPDLSFKKLEEKGFFEFGGSTICLLFKKNSILIDNDIIDNSNKNIETKICIGEKIGKKQD